MANQLENGKAKEIIHVYPTEYLLALGTHPRLNEVGNGPVLATEPAPNFVSKPSSCQ